jgi:hypothetical protein
VEGAAQSERGGEDVEGRGREGEGPGGSGDDGGAHEGESDDGAAPHLSAIEAVLVACGNRGSGSSRTRGRRSPHRRLSTENALDGPPVARPSSGKFVDLVERPSKELQLPRGAVGPGLLGSEAHGLDHGRGRHAERHVLRTKRDALGREMRAVEIEHLPLLGLRPARHEAQRGAGRAERGRLSVENDEPAARLEVHVRGEEVVVREKSRQRVDPMARARLEAGEVPRRPATTTRPGLGARSVRSPHPPTRPAGVERPGRAACPERRVGRRPSGRPTRQPRARRCHGSPAWSRPSAAGRSERTPTRSGCSRARWPGTTSVVPRRVGAKFGQVKPGQERLKLPGVMRKRYAELGEDEEIVAGPQTPESVLYVLSTANRTKFLGEDIAAQMAVGMVRFLGNESRQEDVLSQLIRRIVGGGSGTVSQLGSIRLQLRDPSSHEPCGLRPDLPEGPYQGHPRQPVSPRRRSRIASVRKRSAFSRINPAASRWS